MNFTAHNIKLDDGTYTISSNSTLLADSQLWNAIARSVKLHVDLPFNNKSVIDLGCLEGGYAVEFARMGFDTLGIEARVESYQKCIYATSHLSLPNVKFAKDDAKNISNYGTFDVTFCCGLFYHLDNPTTYLSLLSQATRRILILQTHYAPESDWRYACGGLNSYILSPLEKILGVQFGHKQNYCLSQLTKHEGNRGRWFREWTPFDTKKSIDAKLWASYSNSRSFWLCKSDLVQALIDVGFDVVYEQFDFVPNIKSDNYINKLDRSLFIAVKT